MAKLNQHLVMKRNIKTAEETRILLCGASIVNGFQRYSGVWDSYFSPLKAANIGIVGDKVENILWRVEDLELPSSLIYFYIAEQTI